MNPGLYSVMADSHRVGSAAANTLLSGAQNAATNTAGSQVPGFQTDSPRESGFDDGAMEREAGVAVRNNQAATMIADHSGTRQKYVIDPNTDPMMINANRAHANPLKTMEEMVMEIPAGAAGNEEIHQCMEGGDEYFQSCRKHLVIKIQITPSTTVLSHYQQNNQDCNIRSDREGMWCVTHGGGGCPADTPVYKTTPRSVEIVSEEWVDGCGALEAQSDAGLCRYAMVDEGRPETKTIKGPVVGTDTTDSEPITRDSWEKIYTYACLKKVEENCQGLRSKGCLQVNSVCVETIGGVCVVWRQTYKCPSNKRKTTRYKTTNPQSPFCLTGDCTNSDYEANGELLNAMSHLAILKEAQNDIRANVGIFKGKIRKCSKNCAGFRDCCTTGKGWGVSMHLSSCSGEEKELAQWRAKKRCVFVGTYCAEKILGKCTRKKSSFCCFGNKLSRLLNEQGRRQLRIGWGNASGPDCRGLTPEELSRIDMSQMDLSELYEDIQANFKPQTSDHMAKGIELERIKENMSHMTGKVRIPSSSNDQRKGKA